MLRSMFSGVSGLRSHQTMMDVIGNNIANVNTAGFKASRVVFSDIYYQMLSAAGAPTDDAGGTNPTQIGYGSSVASIDLLNTRGGYMQTDRTTDLYISGDGYFAVQDSAGQIFYTRVGNFKFDGYDEEGHLVDAYGNFVCGLSDGDTSLPSNMEPDDLEPIAAEDYAEYSNTAIGPDGVITAIDKDGKTVTIGRIVLAKFANPDGLIQNGSMYMSPSSNSGEPVFFGPGASASAGSIVSNGLEMSNVDLSKQFTDMIIAQRGFQANSRVITTSDEILQELVSLKR